MAHSPFRFDIAKAEAGATPEMLKATESIMDLLRGFGKQVALTALVNAVAIVIAETCDGEVASLEEAKYFRKAVEHALTVNYRKGAIR